MGQGTDNYFFVMFQITVLGLSHSVWVNELSKKHIKYLKKKLSNVRAILNSADKLH